MKFLEIVYSLEVRANKVFILAGIFILQSVVCVAQPRVPFSDKKVEIDGRLFLPYTEGEVSTNIDGSYRRSFEKIVEIITGWDSLQPLQGIKIHCFGSTDFLEIYFLPYLYDQGKRIASEGGPSIKFSANHPESMFGTPVVSNIFLCPQKVGDFYGFPIYESDRHRVVIVSMKNIPIFVPVSQEEYLIALIGQHSEDVKENSTSGTKNEIVEIEETYQKLLETDKEAAKEFRQQMDEFLNELNKSGDESNIPGMVASLKNELHALTRDQRELSAYYSVGAMEKYHNFSGLVPVEDKENGAALVKANPDLIDNSGTNRIQLLVVGWSLHENNLNTDKAIIDNERLVGFPFAEKLRSQLFHCPEIWTKIFRICE